MPTKDAVAALFAHPATREVARRIGKGDDPRHVAADMAADALRRQMLNALGAMAKPAPWTHEGEVDGAGEPVDAEYTVIDVTPGVKRRTKT